MLGVYKSSIKTWTQELQDVQRYEILNVDFEKKKNEASTSSTYYNWRQAKPEHELKLEKKGVPLHFGYRNHSHPFSKTLETFILVDKVRPTIQKTGGGASWSFLSIKKDKKEKMLGVTYTGNLFNRRIVGRDRIRYGKGIITNEQFKDDMLKTLESRQGKPIMKNVFIHDEIHYWNKDHLIDFLEMVKPEMVLATLVYPPELLIGIEQSQNPDLYQFSVEGDRLLWAPDGQWSEKYEQPVDCAILKTNKILLENGDYYSVELIFSAYSHHLVLISKNNIPSEKFRIFSDFESVNPFCLEALLKRPCRQPINAKHLTSLFTYMSSLKKPDLESIEAKYRQLTELDSSETHLAIMDLFKDLLNVGIEQHKVRAQKKIEHLPRDILDFIKDNLQDDIVEWLPGGKMKLNRKYMRQINPMIIKIELDVCNHSIVRKSMREILSDQDLTFFQQMMASKEVKNELIPKDFDTFLRDYDSGLFDLNNDERDRVVTYRMTLDRESNMTSYPSIKMTDRLWRNYKPSSCSRAENWSNVRRWGKSGLLNWTVEKKFSMRIRSHNTKIFYIDESGNVSLLTHLEIKERIFENRQRFDTFEDVDIMEEREPEEIMADEMAQECAETFFSVPLPSDEWIEKACNRKNNCLIKAVAEACCDSVYNIIENLYLSDPLYWFDRMINDDFMTEADIAKMVTDLPIQIELTINGEIKKYQIHEQITHTAKIVLENGHFSKTPEEIITLTENSRRKGFINKLINSSEGRKLLNGPFKVSPIPQAAMTLAGEIKEGRFGLVLKGKDLTHFIPSEMKFKQDIYLIMGLPGCGKSHPVQELLSMKNTKGVEVITPRTNLAVDWEVKTGRKIYTYEVALEIMFKAHTLVIDEFTMYPPGYIDLLLVKQRNVEQVILIGDPLQCGFHDIENNSLNKINQGSQIHLRVPQESLTYQYFSWRLPKQMSEMFDFECLGEDWLHEPKMYGDIKSAVTLVSKEQGIEPHKVPILVASNTELITAKTYNLNAFTFSGSQGLTFQNHYIIGLSYQASSLDDRSWFTALTRGKKGFSFFLSGLNKLENFSPQSNSIIDRVLNKKKVSKEYLTSLLKFQTIPSGISGGFIDEVDREEKLKGDPYLKAQIFLGQRIQHVEPSVQEIEMKRESNKIHLCIVNKSSHDARVFERIRAREYREKKESYGWSKQFQEDPHPFNYEAIYPRHKNDDDVTFWMAVKKRLRFSNPITEKRKLSKAMTKGALLLARFEKHITIPGFMEHDLLELAQEEFEKKKLEKSAATIANHVRRSEPEWDLSQILLFMKSQLCTKLEKRFCDAKAGQTLACFHHNILLYFSRWSRYIEKKLTKYLPKNVYIHQRKNMEQMEDWCKHHMNSNQFTDSDYEAFDSSQDQTILAFEILFMKKLNIPQEVVDSYVDLKINLGCKLGTFAIMRFTGEFSTFIFNTLANMAFTFSRYKVNLSNTSIAFAGDDMIASRKLEVDRTMDLFFEKMTLKAKVNVSDRGQFCGWIVGGFGIVKNPILVYERFRIAKEKGNLNECIENYLIEFGFAYRLGDRLNDILNEEELDCHYILTRSFVKEKERARGKAANLIREIICI